MDDSVPEATDCETSEILFSAQSKREDCVHSQRSSITVRADTQTSFPNHSREFAVVLLIIIFEL